jgi:hypothetical protein
VAEVSAADRMHAAIRSFLAGLEDQTRPEQVARTAFALGMEVEALEPLLTRMRDAGLCIVSANDVKGLSDAAEGYIAGAE